MDITAGKSGDPFEWMYQISVFRILGQRHRRTLRKIVKICMVISLVKLDANQVMI